MNKRTLVVGLFCFGLLITALITRRADIAWMLLPFLAYLGLGILQTPTVESLRLSATRSLEQRLTEDGRLVDVRVEIRNEAAQTVYLFIQDPLQIGMRVTDGELSRRLALRPGETGGLAYTFTATRGDFAWGALRVQVSDPLGLLETEVALPAAAGVQVRPTIKKFKAIHFRPQSTLHAPGSIPARLGGSGTDFFGVREYHPGDPLRSLDWRLTARHPRKFFTKEFEQEEIAEIGLILDARPKADLRMGDVSLFEASLGATASLAEMFLHQGHRVSLLVFGDSLSNVFPGYGKLQLQRIMSCLAKARVGTENHASAGSLSFLPIRMFPSRALVIVISSLTATDRSLFLQLRASGYQALLISPDPLELAYASPPQELARRLALRATRIERRLWLKDIAQLQIPVIDWQVSQPLFPLVRNALARSRGQRE